MKKIFELINDIKISASSGLAFYIIMCTIFVSLLGMYESGKFLF